MERIIVIFLGLLSINFLLNSCKTEASPQEIFVIKNDQQLREIHKATIAPTIDGLANDPTWEKGDWYPLDQRWIGKKYKKEDLQGHFKLAWTPEGIYILAEIKDDVLYDNHPDPLDNFWNDDCLEIFVDEDNSGGDHQYNYNAFAYHVALDGNVVDTSIEAKPRLYNEHVQSERKTQGNTTTWELRVTLYAENYKDDMPMDQVILEPNKKIGFALAYCDNDSSKERENFIGSIPVKGKDKNRGWIDAGIFGTLLLLE